MSSKSGYSTHQTTTLRRSKAAGSSRQQILVRAYSRREANEGPLFTVREVPPITGSTFGQSRRKDRWGTRVGFRLFRTLYPDAGTAATDRSVRAPRISTARGPSSSLASCRSSSSVSDSPASPGGVRGLRPTLQQIAGGSVLDLDPPRGAPRGASWPSTLVAPPVVGRRRLAGGQGPLTVGQRDPKSSISFVAALSPAATAASCSCCRGSRSSTS